MAYINENFLKIESNYLFTKMSMILNKLSFENKHLDLIDMSIGDVKLPLSDLIIKSLHEAANDMSVIGKFKGYGPEQGYDFLRKSICKIYKSYTVDFETDDIFINDGSKSDLGNIMDIFSEKNIIGIPSVCYPVYKDVSKMKGCKILYIKSCESNNFLPMPDEIKKDEKVDIIYLCSPNNPTGTAYNRNQLSRWVEYAIDGKKIILYDAAYEAFIRESDIPNTIYEIDGSKECVIEFNSLSKSAGFTGLRCGYTIVPKNMSIEISNGEIININQLWRRRQSTKFNGVSYIVQKAANEFLQKESQENNRKNINYYQSGADKIIKLFNKLHFKYWGGINSPYIWLKCPWKLTSQEFFIYMVSECGIIATPGDGFGIDGERYIRLSLFNTNEQIERVFKRIKNNFSKDI